MRIIHLCWSTNAPLNTALMSDGFSVTRVDYAIPWRKKLLESLARQPIPDALVASWPPGIGTIGSSSATTRGPHLHPADDDGGSLVQWLRRQPDSWLMPDGRRWNAVPFVVILDRSFASPYVEFADDPIYLTWPEGCDGRGAHEVAVPLREVINTYWRALLNELDQCGFLIRYHQGRLVVTAAYDMGAATPLRYHSGQPRRGTPHVLTIHPDAFDRAADVQTFERLIGDPRTTETSIQRFFETHPHFLSESDTLQPLSHPRLVDRMGRVLVPDFLLRPRTASLRDSRWKVLELKRPYTQLLVGSRRRRRLSSEIHHAIRQLLDYGEYFSDAANAAHVSAALGYSLRFPQLAVLVGRMPSGDDARALSSEQARHRHVTLVTYDEILDEQRRLCS